VFWRPRKGNSGKRGGGLNLTAQQWVVAFLIGMATVFAAGYGWRAAQIGSTAAYDDRQSISESIKVEQQQIGVALSVTDDARNYTRYLADYAKAAELDNQAEGLGASGSAAADLRDEARALRRSATERAADQGVFGRATIADDLARPGPTPRSFDINDRIRARTAEVRTGIDSPGQLNPNRWAAEAEAIRDRINGLAVWALVMLVAVMLFTVAEANSARRPVFYAAMGLGIFVLVFGATGGLTTDFFA
jgi:hypothetical protein